MGANDHLEHQFNECVDNIVEVLRQGREDAEIARLARRLFQLLFGNLNGDGRGLIEEYVVKLNDRFGGFLQDYQIRDILRKTAEECCAISNENPSELLASMQCYAQAVKFVALSQFREILRAEKNERMRIAQINLPPDCFLRARQ